MDRTGVLDAICGIVGQQPPGSMQFTPTRISVVMAD